MPAIQYNLFLDRYRNTQFHTIISFCTILVLVFLGIVVGSAPSSSLANHLTTMSPSALSEQHGGGRRLGLIDPTSFAQPELIKTKHVDLDWTIHFDRKTISGCATYTFNLTNKSNPVKEILLDIDEISIESVVYSKNGKEVPLKFNISDAVKTIGSKLTIELPNDIAEETIVVTIAYETSDKASALQWLTPEQTSGKKHPYMFSQCQPIQARSVLPVQDTPAVKFTYRAVVHHPIELNALLSAVRIGSENGVTTYEQSVPIPAYLLAIAVGAIVSRPLGPISNVWAEEAIVDEAAEEFSQTDHMLKTASNLCGEYVWKQYDLLVMPPSFPFGGMENPCLTFLTPTLLAGDKSLATVVAHEIAHSWTGNLVTNANFEHFWLNEGFTMFIQGKITGDLEGAPARDFQAIQGLSELKDTIKHQLANKPNLQKLVVDLSGPISPEDSFSVLPYMKGQNFLRYLEDLLGGAKTFDPFLRKYFSDYAYQSIVTDDFKSSLVSYFQADKPTELAQIDWDLWLFGVGMPPVIPNYDNSLAAAALQHANVWSQGSLEEIKTTDLVAEPLSSHQRAEMLNQLLDNEHIEALGSDWIALLESTYALGANSTKNCDLRVRFVRLCIKARLMDRLPEIIEFANSNFRMKYVRAIYRDFASWPEAKPTAIENFRRVQHQMMAVCSNQITKDLGL